MKMNPKASERQRYHIRLQEIELIRNILQLIVKPLWSIKLFTIAKYIGQVSQ